MYRECEKNYLQSKLKRKSIIVKAIHLSKNTTSEENNIKLETKMMFG